MQSVHKKAAPYQMLSFSLCSIRCVHSSFLLAMHFLLDLIGVSAHRQPTRPCARLLCSSSAASSCRSDCRAPAPATGAAAREPSAEGEPPRGGAQICIAFIYSIFDDLTWIIGCVTLLDVILHVPYKLLHLPLHASGDGAPVV